jgi:hypothetical protein
MRKVPHFVDVCRNFGTGRSSVVPILRPDPAEMEQPASPSWPLPAAWRGPFTCPACARAKCALFRRHARRISYFAFAAMCVRRGDLYVRFESGYLR